MLKLPCLLVFIVGVSTATDVDSEPAAVEDPLISMYQRQETLLTNIPKEMLVKFNEVAVKFSDKFSELSTKLESLDRKYEGEVAAINKSLAEIRSIVTRNCPAGFYGTGQDCYKFTTTQMNFKDADAECKRAGGHLWEIDSTSEANEVVELMKKSSVPTGYYFWWTGGLRRSGKWVWERTGAPMTYTKWRPGRPRSDASRVRLIVYYSNSVHMALHDVQPIEIHYSICEV